MTEYKFIPLWVGVNKDGFIAIHAEQPIRNEKFGKWVSSKPFCNSAVQYQIENTIANSSMSWANDTEYFEIKVSAPQFML